MTHGDIFQFRHFQVASCQDIRVSRLATVFDSSTAASVALVSEKMLDWIVRLAKKTRNAHNTYKVVELIDGSTIVKSLINSHDARTSR